MKKTLLTTVILLAAINVASATANKKPVGNVEYGAVITFKNESNHVISLWHYDQTDHRIDGWSEGVSQVQNIQPNQQFDVSVGSAFFGSGYGHAHAEYKIFCQGNNSDTAEDLDIHLDTNVDGWTHTANFYSYDNTPSNVEHCVHVKLTPQLSGDWQWNWPANDIVQGSVTFY